VSEHSFHHKGQLKLFNQGFHTTTINKPNEIVDRRHGDIREIRCWHRDNFSIIFYWMFSCRTDWGKRFSNKFWSHSLAQNL